MLDDKPLVFFFNMGCNWGQCLIEPDFVAICHISWSPLLLSVHPKLWMERWSENAQFHRNVRIGSRLLVKKSRFSGASPSYALVFEE